MENVIGGIQSNKPEPLFVLPERRLLFSERAVCFMKFECHAHRRKQDDIARILHHVSVRGDLFRLLDNLLLRVR